MGLPCLGCSALGASEDAPCRPRDAAQSGHLGCVSTLALSAGSPELLSVSQTSRLGTRAPEDDLDPPQDAAAPEGLQLVRDGGPQGEKEAEQPHGRTESALQLSR